MMESGPIVVPVGSDAVVLTNDFQPLYPNRKNDGKSLKMFKTKKDRRQERWEQEQEARQEMQAAKSAPSSGMPTALHHPESHPSKIVIIHLKSEHGHEHEHEHKHELEQENE
jgi:hypothetical protein